MNEQLYYIQDTRDYVGNSVVWWALNSQGYTSDIDKAQKYTEAEAKGICQNPVHIAWPCDHVNQHVLRHVDYQYLDKSLRTDLGAQQQVKNHRNGHMVELIINLTSKVGCPKNTIKEYCAGVWDEVLWKKETRKMYPFIKDDHCLVYDRYNGIWSFTKIK